MKTVILIADVYSVFHHNKKPIQYGKKGECLTVKSEHGKVLIVENSNHVRFPVTVTHVLMQ